MYHHFNEFKKFPYDFDVKSWKAKVRISGFPVLIYHSIALYAFSLKYFNFRDGPFDFEGKRCNVSAIYFGQVWMHYTT